MENEQMITLAIQTLKSLDLKSVETVQLNRTKYDDGSVSYTVEVSFPATEIEQDPSERK